MTKLFTSAQVQPRRLPFTFSGRPEQIDHLAARAFWSDPTQRPAGLTPDDLPAFGVEYWACGDICGAFRQGPWPGVFMADYGVKPDGWGRLTEPAKAILAAFWKARNPQLIVGWTETDNRAALAFSKRMGFRVTGEMELASGVKVTSQEWRP